MGDEADVTPVAQLQDLGAIVAPRLEDGPVLVQVEYRFAPEQRHAFLRAIRRLEAVRRRNGAYDWRVFRDLADEDLFVERYIVDSWAEYQRLRSRMTVAERQLHRRAAALQKPDTEIRISRLIGIDPYAARESAPETAGGVAADAASAKAPGDDTEAPPAHGAVR
jgi:hypothetical protein